jgi:hypothetical protein
MASKSTRSAAVAGAAVPGVSGGLGVEQKIADNIFQPWQIQHLHVEFRDERQTAAVKWGQKHETMQS